MKDKSIYSSLSEWRKVDPNAYNAAKFRGILPDILKIFGWEMPSRKKIKMWTKEECIKIAENFSSYIEWRKNDRPSYEYAWRNKMISEICEKFGWFFDPKSQNEYWTKENCIEEAKKYNVIYKWKRESRKSYYIATKNKWVEECTVHMLDFCYVPKNFWTKENCIIEAKKYNTIKEWHTNSASSYGKARKNNWMKECTSHMVELQKPPGYWTKEKCIEEARKYATTKEWKKASQSSYVKSFKENWFDECTSHMSFQQKSPGFWTKEKCIEEAKKYNVISEWRKSSPGSYSKASTLKIIKECTMHMKIIKKPNGYWKIKENCIAEAKKHTTKAELHKASSVCLSSSIKNGWYEECCAHMVSKA